jgi:hypothetical protein
VMFGPVPLWTRLSAARNSSIINCLAQQGSARYEFSNFNLLDRKLIG